MPFDWISMRNLGRLFFATRGTFRNHYCHAKNFHKLFRLSSRMPSPPPASPPAIFCTLNQNKQFRKWLLSFGNECGVSKASSSRKMRQHRKLWKIIANTATFPQSSISPASREENKNIFCQMKFTAAASGARSEWRRRLASRYKSFSESNKHKF